MNTTIKTLGATLFAAFTLAAAGGAVAGQLDDIKKAGVITVGTEGTYPPFTYHNDANKLTGYDVEVAKLIAKHLGVKVKFVETQWDGMIAGLDAKRYDVVINQVTPTPVRRQKYDFSEPYTYYYGALIVSTKNNTIKSFDDVKGKKAAQTLNSNWNETSTKLGAEIVPVTDSAQSFLLVESGRADLTINSTIAFADFLKQKKGAQVKAVAQSPESLITNVLIRKGNPDLVQAINEAIAAIQKDGSLSKISLEFLNTDVSHR